MNKKQKKMLLRIILAAVMLVALSFAPVTGLVRIVLYLIPYLTVGYDILIKAAKGIKNRQMFDECFLMAIATIGAIALALYERSGDYTEAIAVMLFYQIGEWFQSYAVGKSRRNISELMDIRPDYANIERDGKLEQVDPDELEIGSVIVVQPGEKVPIDGVIIEGTSSLNTSALTGESLPREAGVGDEVISGCINMSGVLKIRTTKEFGESTVSKILDMVENASSKKSRSENFISKFAKYYTPAVCYGALALAILPPLVRLLFLGMTPEWGDWVMRALTFLVISCPCALVLSVPLAFFTGIGAGSKKGILFKGGVAIEALQNVKAVVMDKTGTITKGNFVVQEIVPAGSYSQDELLKTAASCEEASSHPIAVSIMAAANERRLSVEHAKQVKEISGNGILAELSEGTVLCGNRRLLEQNQVDLSAYQPKAYGTEVLLAVDGVYAGYLVISDTVKEDASQAVAAMKQQNIRTVMLTGDAKENAQAVAEKIGIDEVHAKLLPQDKVTELQKIRQKQGSVMFVGDGINDAPVLAGADVGAAMGSGADAAIEAADVVFMTSSMEAIPQSLKIARATGRIAKQNVAFALVIKALVMVFGLLGLANMWMAVFADTGVAVICILNAIRILYKKL